MSRYDIKTEELAEHAESPSLAQRLSDLRIRLADAIPGGQAWSSEQIDADEALGEVVHLLEYGERGEWVDGAFHLYDGSAEFYPHRRGTLYFD